MLLKNTWLLFASLDLLLAAAFSIFVLSRRKRHVSVTLSWILAFFIFPYAGVAFYLLVGFRSLARRRKLELDSAGNEQAEMRDGEPPAMATSIDEDLQKAATLGKRLTGFGPVHGNKLTIYEEGAATYRAISDAVLAAKRFVHMQYYIFQPDETGLFFRDLLVRRQREGVQCRLLVDRIGSFKLSADFLRPLFDAGVHFAFFGPVRLLRPWGFHLRNHRKLVVIDGSVGFMGSQNIGNEYARWKHRRLSWRDTHVQIEGPGVSQLESVFRRDWEAAGGGEITEVLPCWSRPGNSIVQMLPTGPDEFEPVLEIVLLSLIYAARHRITLTTPYFIPSEALLTALYAAAMRGVAVELMAPTRSDVRLVDWVAWSWYRELIRAGVKIYLGRRAFVHAKVLTVDDRAVLLGSANMDQRSFRLNFESTVLIYDSAVTARLTESFEGMKKQSRELHNAEFEAQSFFADVRDGAFRLLSPLL